MAPYNSLTYILPAVLCGADNTKRPKAANDIIACCDIATQYLAGGGGTKNIA